MSRNRYTREVHDQQSAEYKARQKQLAKLQRQLHAQWLMRDQESLPVVSADADQPHVKELARSKRRQQIERQAQDKKRRR